NQIYSISPPPLSIIYSTGAHRAITSFPTRRSSDLPEVHQPEVQPMWEDKRWWRKRVPRWWRKRLPWWSRLVRPSVYWVNQGAGRSEEHTSELQSRGQLVCRLLPEKNKKYIPQSLQR